MAESQEAVALELLRVIAVAENKLGSAISTGWRDTNREWVLTTYAQCLEAVKQRKFIPIEALKG